MDTDKDCRSLDTDKDCRSLDTDKDWDEIVADIVPEVKTPGVLALPWLEHWLCAWGVHPTQIKKLPQARVDVDVESQCRLRTRQYREIGICAVSVLRLLQRYTQRPLEDSKHIELAIAVPHAIEFWTAVMAWQAEPVGGSRFRLVWPTPLLRYERDQLGAGSVLLPDPVLLHDPMGNRGVTNVLHLLDEAISTIHELHPFPSPSLNEEGEKLASEILDTLAIHLSEGP